jgi:hypothetical protein
MLRMRGGSRFCGPWSLCNFEGPSNEKEYRITNIKLGTKVNI